MSNCNKDVLPETVALAWLDDEGGDHAPPPETKILSIANVAEMFGVSRFALRYYEFCGLIQRRERIERQWVYSWADCERLALIIKCRKVGVRLRDITTVIDAAEDDASKEASKIGQEKCMALVNRLEQRRKKLDAALEELSHLYALLSTKILSENEPKRD